MKVLSPADFSFVTPLARPVRSGEEVEVDDATGEQLLAQGWKTKGASKRAVTAPPAQED